MSAHNFYAVLGVEPDASPDELRRAYYRKVKVHTPEKDPKMFQVVRQAYETLSDPRRRAEYDAMERHGGQVAMLIEEATEALEDDNPEDAVAPLQRAIALNPHSETPWSMLGIVYLQLEAYDDARKVYARLIRDHPDTAAYHARLGLCFFHACDFDEARRCFVHAHELEPYNPLYCILVSRCYRNQERWLQAASWAEKAIGADGKEDVQDFDAFEELAIIYGLQRKLDQLAGVAQRASATLADDLEAREYGAMRFAAIGAQFLNAKAIEAASACFNAALQLAPHHAMIREAADNMRSAAAAVADCRMIASDGAIIPPIRALVACRVYLALGLVEAREFQLVLQREAKALFTWSAIDIHRSISRLTRYPAAYELSKDILNSLLSGRGPHSSASGDTRDGWCCCGCLVASAVAYLIYSALTH